jgi:multidrug resistance efflux pump
MYAIAIGPQSRAQTWIAAHEARVDGRVVDVTATRSGRIHHLLVTEGEAVERGIRLVPVPVALRPGMNASVVVIAG